MHAVRAFDNIKRFFLVKSSHAAQKYIINRHRSHTESCCPPGGPRTTSIPWKCAPLSSKILYALLATKCEKRIHQNENCFKNLTYDGLCGAILHHIYLLPIDWNWRNFQSTPSSRCRLGSFSPPDMIGGDVPRISTPRECIADDLARGEGKADPVAGTPPLGTCGAILHRSVGEEDC
jgi:hypothetical protein